jgi:GNAT superfamily N-acetyltransferase
MAARIAAVFGDDRPVRVEDAFSVVDLGPLGYEADFVLPVMARPPGPAPAPPEGVGVRAVADLAGLRAAERVIVEGFPMAGREGGILPPAVLGLPGYAAWLAQRDGGPAGAVVGFDDGASLGLYYVATLPEHRGRGVARALVRAALAAVPDRPAVLTATPAGEPLYRGLGFRAVGTATWWLRDGGG